LDPAERVIKTDPVVTIRLNVEPTELVPLRNVITPGEEAENPTFSWPTIEITSVPPVTVGARPMFFKSVGLVSFCHATTVGELGFETRVYPVDPTASRAAVPLVVPIIMSPSVVMGFARPVADVQAKFPLPSLVGTVFAPPWAPGQVNVYAAPSVEDV
jgi:hypothetical protein